MTGTAATEATEFWEIYKLDVATVPTNKPVRRIDYPDVILKTKKQKYQAIVDEIGRWHEIGRPVLLGTTSVEVSELISRLLKRRKIPHQVLNAKHHEREAHIVERAGQYGAVTIATNMAGRGTDIKLDRKVLKAKQCAIHTDRKGEETCERSPKACIEEGVPCGLFVLGTERHEARRIDNQLRGRSGRQGDPGSSRFILSLEDDLLRLFGSDRVVEIMERFGGKDEEAIESGLVTRALENAQRRVEMRNFEIRKRLLEYDDVMNRQREVVYGLRNDILDGKDLEDLIVGEYASTIVQEKLQTNTVGEEEETHVDVETLRSDLAYFFLSDFGELEPLSDEVEILESAETEIRRGYDERKEAFGEEKMSEILRYALLGSIDVTWREHLYSLDHLKEGIFLRAYGHKDPLVEYKQESFALFEALMDRIRDETVQKVFRVQVPKLQIPKRYRDRIRVFKPDAQKAGMPAQPAKKQKQVRKNVPRPGLGGAKRVG
jgi:preprotein translocase subunit SecA